MNAPHPLLSCLASYPNPPKPLELFDQVAHGHYLESCNEVNIYGIKKGFVTILDIEIMNFFAGPT